ncbi:hypothetical protein D9M70_438920 [compost metagenome]
MPARHRRAAHAARDGAQQVAVIRHGARRREAELEHTQGEIARAVLLHERGGRSVAIALDAMAAQAATLIHVLAVRDPLLRTRDARLRGLHLLRLEAVAPLAAVGAELLQVGHQRAQVFRVGDQDHGLAGEFLVGGQDHGVLAPLRDIEQAGLVGCQRDGLAAAEIEQLPGRGRVLDGAAPLLVGHQPCGVRLGKQRGEARHDRVGRQHARIPEVRQVPGIAVLQADAREIRADAPRREQVRQVERVFAGLGDRAPAPGLAGDGAHELRVAVPAAFARIDLAAPQLQRRVVGGACFRPLELAQVGAHHLGDLVGARLRLQHRQHALHEGGQREAAEARDQRIEAQAIAAVGAARGHVDAPRTAPAAPGAVAGSADSTVRIRL